MAHLPTFRLRHSLSLLTVLSLIAACSGDAETGENSENQGGQTAKSGAGGSTAGTAGKGGNSAGNTQGGAGTGGSTAAGKGGAGQGGNTTAGGAGQGGNTTAGGAGQEQGGDSGEGGNTTAGTGGNAGEGGDTGQGGNTGQGGDTTAGSGGDGQGGEAGEGGNTTAGAGGDGQGGGSGEGGQAGDAGASGCGQGEVLCGSTCVDLQTSESNCGACGLTCNSLNGTASCISGNCEIDCSAGFSKCGNECVDLQADAIHCGSCDTKCSTNNSNSICVSGVCQLDCAAGFADCDGDLSNGCEASGSCTCTPGEQADCYDGPDGTKGVGLCKGGKKTCNTAGTGYGPCDGQVLPTAETCSQGSATDEDCDGQVNEVGGDPSCACTAGSQQSCYEGPLTTLGVGLCKAGTKTCLADGTGYGPCDGQVLPKAETCAAGNTDDENCDGEINEGGKGCSCSPGTYQPCYDHGLNSPELNTPKGLCIAGIQQCKPDGTGYGACNGQVLPSPEVCDENEVDEDCDGQSNESGAGCECQPGQTSSCWEGPSNAVFGGTSICKKGTRTCQPSGKWGSCLNQVLPGIEPVGICTTNIDEDCNGDPLGPGGQDLDGDGWTACGGDCCETTAQCTDPKIVNPGAFDVPGNNLDDDCDGTKDNGVLSCDSALGSNSNTPMDYAKAMDLCQTATENDPQKRWGVIKAELLRADGSANPNANSKSIRSKFGNNILPKKGSKLAAFSTGTAASPGDTKPSFTSVQSGTGMGTASGFPADWLAANGNILPNAPGCPGVNASSAYDPIMLKLRIRVPTNAKSFSFHSYFLSAEFPEWVCTPFNDFFVALLTSSYSGANPNPADKNLAFYDPPPAGAPFYPVGVNLAYLNNGLFRTCKNGLMGCYGGYNKQITTCISNSELIGTGFDPTADSCQYGDQVGGGTGYLLSNGNVKSGEIIEIRFAIWDTSDAAYDSTVLLDNWTWSLNAAQPGTVISQ